MLCQEVSDLQQLVLHSWTCLSTGVCACAGSGRVSLKKLLCCTGTCLSSRACDTPVRVLCRAACNVPGGDDLQQLVLYLDGSVYRSLCLCYKVSGHVCLSTRAFVLHVCLPEPVSHLYLSVYESFCSTWTCLPSRDLAEKDFSVWYEQKNLILLGLFR